MNNSYIRISNSKDFESIISKMEKSIIHIAEILDNESKNIENINSTDIWKGKTQKIVYDKFKELDKNFPIIDESLKYYVDFLKKTINDYKKEEENINYNIEANIEKLDIN